MKKWMPAVVMIGLAAAWAVQGTASAEPSTGGGRGASKDVLGGELRVGGDDILDIQRFPLEHTDVRAEIVGNVARVEVTQTFHNPYDKKIEAVYVFPLPSRAAVDDMEIRVGERTIKGIIKRREEARRIYEAARQAGHVAALLDQERPNIFTQSVANILPGNRVVVKIRYFEALAYVEKDYTFAFPMVVGPRFIPGAATSAAERGWSPNTTAVPDASRITPPVLKPGERSGHDISLQVDLNAGTQIVQLLSPSHQVDIDRQGSGRARILLEPRDSIPNKDFVLRYRLDADAPRVALLPHRKEGDGYFLMLIQPEARPTPDEITPKEMVFVVDCSGSMSGFPIEKVKEAMRHSLANLNSADTFQIIRFSNQAEAFAPAPVPATAGNVRRGIEYIGALSGSGGTIMLEGVRAALTPPEDPGRLRIISFMTDGYIGNEDQILAYLERNLGRTRLFSFGVGSSVNRYLLDKMAEFGRGAVEYVLLNDDAEAPVKRFYERLRNPYLTDIEIDWGKLQVDDVYPKRIPDLFVGAPVVLYGRYTRPAGGTVTLRARLGGRPYEQGIAVDFPNRHEQGEAIGSLWARARIEELSNRQIVEPNPDLVEEITRVALAHRLVSAHTSFVAVEEQIVTGSDKPVLVEVPVEMPDGVSYEGVFGEAKALSVGQLGFAGGRAQAAAPSVLAEAVDSLGLRRARPAPSKIEVDQPLEAERGKDEQGGLTLRIEAARPSFRVGDPVEIAVILENLTGKPAEVPAALSVVDGTARFQILDAAWKVIAHPTPRSAKPKTLSIQPGARVTLSLVLNGAGGYAITKPGTYHIVLLGADLGLPNSNTLTIQMTR